MLSRRGVLGATSPSLMAALRRLSTVTGHVAPPESSSLGAPPSRPSAQGPGAGAGSGSFLESAPAHAHGDGHRGHGGAGERGGQGYHTLAAGAASAALLGAAFSTVRPCHKSRAMSHEHAPA